MVKCLINPNHRIPASKANEHMQECSLRKEGYSKNDKFLSEPNYIPGSTMIIGKFNTYEISTFFLLHSNHLFFFTDDPTKVQILNQALTQNPIMKTGTF